MRYVALHHFTNANFYRFQLSRMCNPPTGPGVRPVLPVNHRLVNNGPWNSGLMQRTVFKLLSADNDVQVLSASHGVTLRLRVSSVPNFSFTGKSSLTASRRRARAAQRNTAALAIAGRWQRPTVTVTHTLEDSPGRRGVQVFVSFFLFRLCSVNEV